VATIRVSVRELKNRLSHYLRLVKAGHIVEITERGRSIGQVIRISPTRHIEERLDAMATLGLLSRAEGRLASRAPVARTRGPKSVASILVEERNSS